MRYPPVALRKRRDGLALLGENAISSIHRMIERAAEAKFIDALRPARRCASTAECTSSRAQTDALTASNVDYCTVQQYHVWHDTQSSAPVPRWKARHPSLSRPHSFFSRSRELHLRRSSHNLASPRWPKCIPQGFLTTCSKKRPGDAGIGYAK